MQIIRLAIITTRYYMPTHMYTRHHHHNKTNNNNNKLIIQLHYLATAISRQIPFENRLIQYNKRIDAHISYQPKLYTRWLALFVHEHMSISYHSCQKQQHIDNTTLIISYQHNTTQLNSIHSLNQNQTQIS